MNEPQLNFENMDSSTSKKTKKNKRTKIPKETVTPSTRQIPFRKKWYSNGLTVFLYTLFIVMSMILLLTFTRYDRMVTLANEKAIDPSLLVKDMKNGAQEGNIVAFDGQRWLDLFITSPDSDEEEEARQEKLMASVSTAFNASSLTSSTVENKRKVDSIQFIQQKTMKKSEKGNLYYTLYQVRFEEQGKPQEMEVGLYAIYQENHTVIVQMPEFLSIDKNNTDNNNSPYTEDDFLIKGTEVEGVAKEKISLFMEKFLELYCRNDENLNLVSALKGLNGATLESATITNIVKKDRLIYVQGTYTFYYVKDSLYTSNFTFEIKPNKDSYFVIDIPKVTK